MSHFHGKAAKDPLLVKFGESDSHNALHRWWGGWEVFELNG